MAVPSVINSSFALELKGGETFRFGIVGAHGFRFCFLCVFFFAYFLLVVNFRLLELLGSV